MHYPISAFQEIFDAIRHNQLIVEYFDAKLLDKYLFDGYLDTADFYRRSWNLARYSKVYFPSLILQLYEKVCEDTPESIENNIARGQSVENLEKIFTIVIEWAVLKDNPHEDAKKIPGVKGNDSVTEFVYSYIILRINDLQENQRSLALSPIKIASLEKPTRHGSLLHKYNIRFRDISSVADALSLVEEMSIPEDFELFFRGHENKNFILLPSFMRKEIWYRNEKWLYDSLIRYCPRYFQQLTSHVDRLVEMQHYELPTRLLDISKNILVALFFACYSSSGSSSYDGELIVFAQQKDLIKPGRSDLVSIFSGLAGLTREQKIDLNRAYKNASDDATFNRDPAVHKLVDEIRTEKPGFREEIKRDDLKKCVLTTPSLLNDRIIKQSGAFILTGLYDHFERAEVAFQLNQMRYRDAKTQEVPVLRVLKGSKKSINKELEFCDITLATLFPEIDKVAGFIKGKV